MEDTAVYILAAICNRRTTELVQQFVGKTINTLDTGCIQLFKKNSPTFSPVAEWGSA